jgi:hypothetical protein
MSDQVSVAGQASLPPSPYQIQVSYGASAGIARGSGADWFGPLNPLTPIAPPDVAGRRFDFPAGYNLNTRPRAYEPIGFHELRAFADAYDLLRLVIETRKDQMERQRWRIRPRHSFSPSPAGGGGSGRGRRGGAMLDADIQARVIAIEHFFHKPDGVTRWKTWLRALLEDMFVIDAATLYCQRTRSGQLCALQQLDGGTIKRVIDDWGRTPLPFIGPDGATIYPPAYQQVLKGFPAVNYSARDIIYRPRNVRAHKVYGYSPVQQILMTVNIALRRQMWQLDYYTEGSIPDALIGVPQGWTPEQIKQFQDYWDTEFSGDLAKRRRAKFVPGDTAAKVVQTKEPQHKDDFDEWLARIVCFAFSVPPQWAVKLMNRATADNQSEQSEDEGLEPTKEWVKDLIDEIIAEEFGSPDLELVWLNEDDNDLGKNEAALEARVKLGALTLNELRDALGLDPYANPAADRPMVLTATGYVPIEAGVGAKPPAPPSVQKYSPDQPRVPAGNSDGGQWTSGSGDGASDGSSNGSETNNALESNSIAQPVQYAALDTGTRTDATAGGGTSGALDANSSGNGAVLAGNIVTPRGFTVEHIPGENPLDPQGLNKPITADEQQKIADALTLKENGDTSALQPHPYANLPHQDTGAVLPASTAGYTAYDVPGLGTGRGEGRLVVDKATGATYYTNNHYQSFYAIQIHQHGE